MWAFIDRRSAVREKDDDWEGRYRKGIIWERRKKDQKKCRLYGVELRLIFHRYIYYRHHNIITYYTMFLLLFSSLSPSRVRVFFKSALGDLKVHKKVSERKKNGYELYAKRHRSMLKENEEVCTIKIAPECLRGTEKKDTYCA